MTGRTHDLAAFTALTWVFVSINVPYISLATAIAALGANIIGGLAPDIDEPSSKFWANIPAGSILSRIIRPFLGSHRMISHSLIGVFLTGWIANLILNASSQVLIVNMNIVWWAFMVGYLSHLIVDTFTKEGVPWLFPIPINFGIPPFKTLRLTTGAFLEKGLVYPGLLIIETLLIYNNYTLFLDFFKNLAGK